MQAMRSSVQKFLLVVAVLFAVAATVYFFRLTNSQQQSVAHASQRTSPQRPASPIIDATKPRSKERNSESMNIASSDWGTQFRESTDYFDFVSLAAQAALQGNGRAAYYVEVVLTNCTEVVNLAKTSPDPEKDYLENYRRILPYAPQRLFDKATVEAHKCARLGKENAFADLPSREGDYPKKFWHELALKESDPLAEAAQVQTDLPKLSQMKSSEDRQLALVRLQHYIRDAVGSKDPEAIFTIGIALQNSHAVDDNNLQAVAVSLAACDLGYDCSVSNPQNYRQICRPIDVCPDGATYSDRLQQIYRSTLYAEIYSQAQIFKDLLTREDWQELDKFVRIDVK
jgi:hypothetical protein